MDVTASQTDFETAPVTIAAQLAGQALDDESVIVRLTDEVTGKMLDEQTVSCPQTPRPRR